VEVTVASSSDVEQLRGKLGVARGTLVVRWLSTAFDYFKNVLYVDPLDPTHVKYQLDDSRSRLGGDRQIVIPFSTNVALLRERDFDRQKMADMLRAGYLSLGLP
jgi:hypothetical protein